MTLEKKRVYFITDIHLTLQICLCPSERIKNVNIIMRPSNTKLTFTKRKINKAEKFKKLSLDILHVA